TTCSTFGSPMFQSAATVSPLAATIAHVTFMTELPFAMGGMRPSWAYQGKTVQAVCLDRRNFAMHKADTRARGLQSEPERCWCAHEPITPSRACSVGGER